MIVLVEIPVVSLGAGRGMKAANTSRDKVFSCRKEETDADRHNAGGRTQAGRPANVYHSPGNLQRMERKE